MGYNASGIVIGNNYGKSIDAWVNDLGWAVTGVEEISPIDAKVYRTPRGEFYVTFSEKGTVIYCHSNIVKEGNHSSNFESMNFIYFETSMRFFLQFQNTQNQIREIFELERSNRCNDGHYLKIETEDMEIETLIDMLFENLYGIEILLAEQRYLNVYKFKKKSASPINQHPANSSIVESYH